MSISLFWVSPRLLKGRVNVKPRISEKETKLCLWLVLCREEKSRSSGSTLCPGDQIPPSLSPHAWQGLFQMSQWAERRGCRSHWFLKGFFCLFVFTFLFLVAKIGLKKCCPERDMFGKPEWARVNTVLLYKVFLPFVISREGHFSTKDCDAFQN